MQVIPGELMWTGLSSGNNVRWEVLGHDGVDRVVFSLVAGQSSEFHLWKT